VFSKPRAVKASATPPPGFDYFKVSDIDPNLCTHIIYSMAKIDTESYEKLVPYEPSNLGMYSILLS
jgi:hypothetical protein